jgi:hypothetical protein
MYYVHAAAVGVTCDTAGTICELAPFGLFHSRARWGFRKRWRVPQRDMPGCISRDRWPRKPQRGIRGYNRALTQI